MQKINLAFYILDDAERRRRYDMQGEAAFKAPPSVAEPSMTDIKEDTQYPDLKLPTKSAGSDSSENDDSDDDIQRDISMMQQGSGLSDIFNMLFGDLSGYDIGFASPNSEDTPKRPKGSGKNSIGRLAPQKGSCLMPASGISARMGSPHFVPSSICFCRC
jgi:curved DNA-binding protein CbpA